MDYPGKVITKTQVTPTQTSASGNWTLDDQAAAIKNNNWPVALVPNPISKSLRFNSADSAYLNRTVAAAATSNTLTTLSFWFKRAKLGTSQQLFASATSAPNVACYIELTTSDTLKIYLDMTAGGSDETTWTTSAVFRDVSAWYGATIKVDTSQASNANKVVLYINGVSQTLTASQTGTAVSTQRILENGISLTIGKYFNSSGYGDFYLTEFNCIDGQALTPSSFGMTNPQTGQWIPLKYSGTYGTNGFYLNFKDATSTTTLGYDYSGNANNWTTNNFSVTAGAGNDSLTDVPTPWVAYNTTGDVGGVIRGNYCTWNPLRPNASMTYANGNLEAISSGGSGRSGYGTFGMSSGKWYFETTGGDNSVGVATVDESVYANYTAAGGYNINGTTTSGKATYTTSDVIGCAYNADANTIEFFKNGSSQGSTSFSAAAGLSVVAQFNGIISATRTCVANFGQRPFAYTPPTGFRSLCTTNLPATAIGFGLTNQGGKYMNVLTYTGDSATSSAGTVARTITGVGFQPDLIWVKSRNNGGTWNNHSLTDAVRGNNLSLSTNATDAEINVATGFSNGGIGGPASDGFTIVSGTAGSTANLNSSSGTYVAWNWKAAQTLSKTYAVTVVSSGGNKYRFDGFAANAVTLELSEGGTFRFDQSDASNSGHPFRFSTTSDGTHGGGVAYTTGVTVVGTPGTSGAYTEITVAASAPTLYYYCTVHSGMGGQANTPTTNSFSNLTGTIQSNISPNTTAGFSIVTYTGTGANATVGHGLGVAPSMLIVKNRTSGTTDVWCVYHSSLGATQVIILNRTDATATASTGWNNTAPTSSVFSIGTLADVNRSTNNYVAYCFAAVPGYSAFGSYTGNGSTDGPFIYLGFRPKFVMFKSTGVQDWVILDSARDTYNVAGNYLRPNSSGAENGGSTPTTSTYEDFLSNGIKLRNNASSSGYNNTNGVTYIYAAFAESPFQFANAR